MTPTPSTARAALLNALWEARGAEVTLRELVRLTGQTAAQLHTAIDALAGNGCHLERSPAGVRLVTAGLGCWADLLESAADRHGWRIGRRAKVFSTTTSTNDAAWEASSSADGDVLVVLANHQTAGRGRRGHVWQARANQSVLLSALLREVPGGKPADKGAGSAGAALDHLTLLCGLATAEALEDVVTDAGGVMDRIDIKWPNDLLVQGRKLAGILVETRRLPRASATGETGAAEAVVIGIGVNVAQSGADFPPELGGRAVSLYGASGRMLDRARVVLALVARLHQHLFAQTGDAWIDLWRQRCGMLGRRLSFRNGAAAITGHVLDIDPEQGLVVRDDRGATHFLSARTCSVL